MIFMIFFPEPNTRNMKWVLKWYLQTGHEGGLQVIVGDVEKLGVEDQGGSIEIDLNLGGGGDKGHVQDQNELGPRSFGQKLEDPEAVKVGFFQGTFSA